MAARSQLWAAMSRPMWSLASSSHSKRNKGGLVGSDGSARMVDRVLERGGLARGKASLLRVVD
jgi:hypothetical protein